jgi:hypothetical protein
MRMPLVLLALLALTVTPAAAACQLDAGDFAALRLLVSGISDQQAVDALPNERKLAQHTGSHQEDSKREQYLGRHRRARLLAVFFVTGGEDHSRQGGQRLDRQEHAKIMSSSPRRWSPRVTPFSLDRRSGRNRPS